MNDQNKLLQLISDIDNLEDFIKLSGIDGKIDKQVCNEILRQLKEAKTRALK